MGQPNEGSICSIEHASLATSVKRGIGFLIFPGNRSVTAKASFNGCSEKEKKWFRTGFDWWISGVSPNKHRFHGWDKSEYGGRYIKCFVFKSGDGNQLYGFLCHPKRDDPRYEFCVLVVYDSKHEHETDEGMLEISESMSRNLSVRQALMKLFPISSRRKPNGKS